MKKLHQLTGANNLFCNHKHWWYRLLQADGQYLLGSWSDMVFTQLLYWDWLGQDILSLRFSCLSLPSTSTKLLIQGVAFSQASILPLATSCQSLSWKLLSNAKELGNSGLALVWHCHPLNTVWGTRKTSSTIKTSE